MFFDLLNPRDLLYHYEVVITRQGRDQVLARVPTRHGAEVGAAKARRDLEISRQTVYWRRAAGVHPLRMAGLCVVPLVATIALPWLWPRAILSLVLISIICGLVTTGSRWTQGGEDDR